MSSCQGSLGLIVRTGSISLPSSIPCEIQGHSWLTLVQTDLHALKGEYIPGPIRRVRVPCVLMLPEGR